MTVREVILVEGRYDAHAVRGAVDAAVLETNGFGVFRDAELRALLKRLAAERGVIVLTDSDAAGQLIRGHLRGILPAEQVKHAYVPEIPGKERRKTAASKAGLLGVEGMDAQTLRDALLHAGATVGDGPPGQAGTDPITKADLYEWGLSGTADAASRREALLRTLNLPSRMSANALLYALNGLYRREEILDALSRS
jgi:ribonuclease M5